MPSVDVAVVGGGPVGLATAIAARLRDLSVVVLERQTPPIDKACGEGLMPAGVAARARLGVDLPERSRPLRGIRYLSDGLVAEADFPAGARGRGVCRKALHQALVTRAAALGAELRFATKVEAIVDGAVLAAGEAIRPRFLVGADGLHSAIRQAGDFGARKRRANAADRFGVVRHFRIPPWSERVEVTFGDRAEAYVTPLAEDEIGVALLWSGGKADFDTLLRERLPRALAERLAAASVVPATGVRSPDRGAGPFRQRVARRVDRRQRNLALVGDAAGYVDALTGEGLSLGFECAEALASAIACDDLPGYERQARRLAALPDRLTRIALFAARRPALRRRLVSALARDPALFSSLLGLLGMRRGCAELKARDALGAARLLGRLAFSTPTASSGRA